MLQENQLQIIQKSPQKEINNTMNPENDKISLVADEQKFYKKFQEETNVKYITLHPYMCCLNHL